MWNMEFKRKGESMRIIEEYTCSCPYCKGKAKIPFKTTIHENMSIHLWEQFVKTKEVKA